MPTIVVPFRGVAGKRRLEPLPQAVRSDVALAMLGDVLDACSAVATSVTVATSDAAGVDVARAAGAGTSSDPGTGQGAAVGVALGRVDGGPFLIVNADLPCATPRDLLTVLGGMPAGGVAI